MDRLLWHCRRPIRHQEKSTDSGICAARLSRDWRLGRHGWGAHGKERYDHELHLPSQGR